MPDKLLVSAFPTYLDADLATSFSVIAVTIRKQITFYRPRMREGNVFILSVCVSVSLCVCVCVCLCVCLSIRAITSECLDIQTSIFVWWYILTISTSSLNHWLRVKVIFVKLIILGVGYQILLL